MPYETAVCSLLFEPRGCLKRLKLMRLRLRFIITMSFFIYCINSTGIPPYLLQLSNDTQQNKGFSLHKSSWNELSNDKYFQLLYINIKQNKPLKTFHSINKTSIIIKNVSIHVRKFQFQAESKQQKRFLMIKQVVFFQVTVKTYINIKSKSNINRNFKIHQRNLRPCLIVVL